MGNVESLYAVLEMPCRRKSSNEKGKDWGTQGVEKIRLPHAGKGGGGKLGGRNPNRETSWESGENWGMEGK